MYGFLRAMAIVPIASLFLVGASAAELSVKVSTSREDPDLRVVETEADGYMDFFVFVDGGKTRGGEFGLAIEGATFVSFTIDTALVWVSMPMKNPYPGTIAQAIVGSDCSSAPTFFGKVTVTPNERGGRVIVDVIPSLRANSAIILDCDNVGLQNFRGLPATVNGHGKNARDHVVRGDIEEPNENSIVIRNEDNKSNEDEKSATEESGDDE